MMRAKISIGKSENIKLRAEPMNHHHQQHHHHRKSILKQSPLCRMNGTENQNQNFIKNQKSAKSKLMVSINLPDNEIALLKGNTPMRRAASSAERKNVRFDGGHDDEFRVTRTVIEVLRELDADILALQDVKAEEEKAMKPLSDLAAAALSVFTPLK